MLYFAYGSNMCHKQMVKRCPKGKFLKRTFLTDYKFVYDGFSQKRDGAVGNIIKSPGSEVWGGLFEITPECLGNLDGYEEYPENYQRMIVQVKDDDEQAYNAYVYFRTGQKIGIPSDEYRQTVVQGAKDCGLDENYIREFLEA